MANQIVDKIINKIWRITETDPSILIYAILDAARDQEIYHKLRESGIRDCVSLFRGAKARELALVAPYLVCMPRDHDYTKWVVKGGWGNSWGIFLESSADLRTLENHFQQIIMVRNEDNDLLYFRFYDPRVLRNYLPTCNAAEREDFFGPVTTIYMEGPEPEKMTQYSLAPGKLVSGDVEIK